MNRRKKNKKKKLKQRNYLFFLIAIVGLILMLSLFAYEGREYIWTTIYNKNGNQCISFVKKYYKDNFGIEIGSVGAAQNMLKEAPDFGLHPYKNGEGVAPRRDDILVFGNKNKIGHVAVITDVTPSGVKIVEQNWISPYKISYNDDESVPMIIENGKYTIANRGDYWTIGWVSRFENEGGTNFEFDHKSSEGWTYNNNMIQPENVEGGTWRVPVSGLSPRVFSPLLGPNLLAGQFRTIDFRVKVEGAGYNGQGVIFLRDQEGNWIYQTPLTIKKLENGYYEFSASLANIRQDFPLTQFSIQLTQGTVENEYWNFDWIRFVRTTD